MAIQSLLGSLNFFTTAILLLAHLQAANVLHPRISNGYPKFSDKEGLMRVTISEKGLYYARDLLVEQALQSLIPLHIPDMKKSLKFAHLIDLKASLYNIAIANISVPTSEIHLGQGGINIVASQVEMDLKMKWKYSYTFGGFIPITITDKGRALVQVEGMEVGITLRLDEHNGSLYLITMECGTSLKDIAIDLDGGASWLYQGFVDAFEGEIRAAVENAVTTKIKEGIMKLDSLLQNLPKEIGIGDTVALNFTIMQAPLVGPNSITIGVEGLFKEVTPDVHSLSLYDSQSGIFCSGPSKMLEISISEAVLNSATEVYTNEGLLNWVVDKLPEQSLLNTASWRFIVPQLYKKYPNDDMKLNISVSSPPIISITPDGVEAAVVADMIIDVMDGNDTIPVACISMSISASGSMEVLENNITGAADLKDLALKLKWSNVGNFHMRLIQAIVWPLLKDVILPLVNVYLNRGFPLPIIRNFTVQNADIIYGESQLVVCTDVKYVI